MSYPAQVDFQNEEFIPRSYILRQLVIRSSTYWHSVEILRFRAKYFGSHVFLIDSSIEGVRTACLLVENRE